MTANNTRLFCQIQNLSCELVCRAGLAYIQCSPYLSEIYCVDNMFIKDDYTDPLPETNDWKMHNLEQIVELRLL